MVLTASALEHESLLLAAEQRTYLPNISWQLFEAVVAEMGEIGVPKLAYYRGNLEFMTPLFLHEHSNRLIDRVVNTLVEAAELECIPAGSMTIKRPELAAGKEPDSCYYIQNEHLIRNKTRLDFGIDPPPDLAIEVDITHTSIDQLALYAALGVPELWVYDGKSLTFYHLAAGL